MSDQCGCCGDSKAMTISEYEHDLADARCDSFQLGMYAGFWCGAFVVSVVIFAVMVLR